MANTKNLKKGNPATQFVSGRSAVENQKKSAAARKRNNLERRLLKERIIERMKAKDWDEVVDGVIQRAKESDKGFEVFRDTIGEKPVESVELNAEVRNPFDGLTTDELRKLIEDE
jgi:hypothetical protein